MTELENKWYYNYPYSCFTRNVEDDIIVRFMVEPGKRITKVWVRKGVNADSTESLNVAVATAIVCSEFRQR